MTNKTANVESITYSTFGGKLNDKHLLVNIKVVDASTQVGLSSAEVNLEVFVDGVSYMTSSVTTSTDGIGEWKLLNAPSGQYEIKVLSLAHADYLWDDSAKSLGFDK